ncbi:MAG: DUF1553 domain-containing protein [Bacteroidota bacterium]
MTRKIALALRKTGVWISLIVFGAVLLDSLGGCHTQRETVFEVAGLPEQVDFNFHIKPILSDRCFKCHGPDEPSRKGNFRLDTERGAFEALDSLGKKHAIVPGDLEESVLYERLVSKDPELLMPPASSNLPLSRYEIALIGKWIEQGAEWKKHWSFLPPQKSKLPPINNKQWVKNAIDPFVLHPLEQKGLKPSMEAPKEILLRRLSFDLTGLPPTVAEIDSFIADSSSNAYEKAVDRLLASPHYGERMAVEWLDLARYADTHGYQDDGMRNSWPWREWVISAYNRNLPFDQFITWQLAGDLLPKPSKEQLLATSFNRNHPQTQEGGVVDEEYRVEYVADRTNTFGKAFLGLTMECARCHDHKYDPITQKDYFSLFAFFNNNNESGNIPYNGEACPTLILTNPEVEAKLKFIREKLEPHEKKMNPQGYRGNFESWLVNARKAPDKYARTQKGLIGWFAFEEVQKKDKFKNAIQSKLTGKVSGDPDRKPRVVPGIAGNGRKLIGDAGIEFTKELNFDRHQPFSISMWTKLEKSKEEGTLFGKCNGEYEGYRGYRCLLKNDGSLQVSFSYVWPDNCIDFQTRERLDTNRWYHLVLTYDGSSQASGIKLFINGKEAMRNVLADNLLKSIQYGEKKSHTFEMPFSIGRDFHGSLEGVVIDELKTYQRQLSALEIREEHGEKELITRLLKTSESQLSEKQRNDLLEYYLINFDQAFAQELASATHLRDEENQLLTDQPEVMVMHERKEPRPTFLLSRGAYDAPAERVQPATPHQLISFDPKLPRNRLGLARWLVNPRHPLTARVMANRFWAMCFGQGLVSSSDDFGNQGSLPTHPALLDWLAIRLVESGWNIKAFMKILVMSATYRQSSIPHEHSKKLDPNNILYSRGPSFRLSAEMIRDNVLAASGLLVRKIGGPSVYPYQPDSLWEALVTRHVTHYKQGHGNDLYRRSLYTIWKRSTPPPSMMNFDAPDRYTCVVKRQKTATPLQSLVLMNDPQYVEASRILGERMMREGGENPESRIDFAFKALTGRAARLEERELLKKMYLEEWNDFQKNPKRSNALLKVGEFQRDQKLAPAELAACTMLASTIMNFDEMVMRR